MPRFSISESIVQDDALGSWHHRKSSLSKRNPYLILCGCWGKCIVAFKPGGVQCPQCLNTLDRTASPRTCTRMAAAIAAFQLAKLLAHVAGSSACWARAVKTLLDKDLLRGDPCMPHFFENMSSEEDLCLKCVFKMLEQLLFLHSILWLESMACNTNASSQRFDKKYSFLRS